MQSLPIVVTEQLSDELLLRRQEVLAIIKDHRLVSFDFIRRRFSQMSASSLHNDLRVLKRKGFIKKVGSTRGALYKPF